MCLVGKHRLIQKEKPQTAETKEPRNAGLSGLQDGGEEGIRTLDTVSCIHTFQACSFSLSDTSPFLGKPIRSVEAR